MTFLVNKKRVTQDLDSQDRNFKLGHFHNIANFSPAGFKMCLGKSLSVSSPIRIA